MPNHVQGSLKPALLLGSGKLLLTLQQNTLSTILNHMPVLLVAAASNKLPEQHKNTVLLSLMLLHGMSLLFWLGTIK